MKCSVYIICPSVLSCSNLKLRQTLEVKNIFKQENKVLQLTFNPGLTLTGFQTTRPWSLLGIIKSLDHAHFFFSGVIQNCSQASKPLYREGRSPGIRDKDVDCRFSCDVVIFQNYKLSILLRFYSSFYTL